jgi:hypothetical protein
MARGSTRGVQAGMLLLTVSASILAGAGFFVGNQGGNPWWWWYAAIACVVLAALLPMVFWGILPRIRGDHTEESPLGEEKEVNIIDSPGANIQAPKFEEVPGKINVERSPEATVNFDTTDEEEETENNDSQGKAKE